MNHPRPEAKAVKISSKFKPENDAQVLLKKDYQYPANLVLEVPESLPIENIYGKTIRNITPFTEKFKGHMLTYQTHGLYVYPAKFIPQIPQFCIRQFSNPHDVILDPFCGSGTTLVEALLLKRNAYGLDINPLAQLISKVKTTPLDLQHLANESISLEQFLSTNPSASNSTEEVPFFPNLAYWFAPNVLQELVKLQRYIFNIPDVPIQNFFRLILASIIRDVSLADRDQLHPAKTKFSRQKKPVNVSTYEIFRKALIPRLSIMESFSHHNFSDVFAQIIGEDATKINCPQTVDLAVTSPPYVNALDYVRIHKLEAFWTGLLSPQEISSLQRKFIGTDRIYREYYQKSPLFSNEELNSLISQIAIFDKKRAGIVTMYFMKMFQNLREVYRLLRPEGYYCIVIGANNIRTIHIPTPQILISYAEEELGYENIINYSYEIINKRLKIPRASHGGNIKKEWIIVLQRKS
ncbi:MAG: site-specific DNA-methyltransferase [Candidatus Helarchaeota archaeon]|nr:site-specific DNA-methyltransferase [Candidatus Helarchaeota archaeon]